MDMSEIYAQDDHDEIQSEKRRRVYYHDEIQSEKRRRVYYQDIVYAVCNAIDCAFPGKVICGTIEEPSQEVQKRVNQVIRVVLAARHAMSQVDHHGGPWPQYPELHEALDQLRQHLQ